MNCELCQKDYHDTICNTCESDIDYWLEWLKVMGPTVDYLDKKPALDLCPRHIRNYIIYEYFELT
jgi:hypothetical protein